MDYRGPSVTQARDEAAKFLCKSPEELAAFWQYRSLTSAVNHRLASLRNTKDPKKRELGQQAVTKLSNDLNDLLRVFPNLPKTVMQYHKEMTAWAAHRHSLQSPHEADRLLRLKEANLRDSE